MFAIQQNRNPVQRAVCLTLAGFIVSTGLATGAFGMHVAERNATAAIVEADRVRVALQSPLRPISGSGRNATNVAQ